MPPSTRPSNGRAGSPRPGRNPHAILRRRGLVAALVVAAGFALVLGGLLVRGILHTDPRTREAEELEPLARTPIPPGSEAELAGPMEGARIQLTNRDDRTHRIGDLHLARTELIAERQYRVVEPQAWIHLEDGRTVFVRADEGRFYMPDRMAEPESGWLNGDVTVHLFDPRLDGRPIELEHDTPRGTMRTASLHFDRTVGEMSTPNEIHVTAPELNLTVRGLMAIINESRQRLERLETISDGILDFRPGVREQQKTRPTAPAHVHRPARPAGESRTQPAPQPAQPVHAFYGITMRDNVVLTQQGRRIEGDLLDAWLRTIDGEIPEDAIADVRIVGMSGVSAPDEPARPEQTPPAERSASREATQPTGGTTAHAPHLPAPPVLPADDLVRMVWQGPMVVIPHEVAPDELAQNHVALRFKAANEDARVAFNDAASGARGTMSQLEYMATKRQMVLSGPGEDGARIVMPGSGEMKSGRIEGDLGTGVIQGVGPSAFASEGDQDFRISASEGSTLVLGERDGAIVSELKEAYFNGDVLMRGDEGQASAGFARAYFTADGQRANNLALMVLEEAARMETSGGDWLRGDRLDVRFRPGQGRAEPEPTRVIGRGNVRAARNEGAQEESMSAGEIDALLARNEDGRIDIAEVQLRERVEIIRANSRITGEDVLILPEGRVLHVRSGGTFDYEEGPSQISAHWSRQMWFDDLTGRLECEGDVHATSTPDAMTEEKIDAEHLIARITPGGDDARKREVLDVEAGAPPGQLARFQSLNYSEVEGQRVLERMMRLEGERIVADNQQGTLDVPVAGRLVLADHRPEDAITPEAGGEASPEASPETAPTPIAMTGRGDVLLDWTGWLHINRATGELQAETGVEAVHLRPADGDVTELSCERLLAQITPQDDSVLELGGGREALPAGERGIRLLSAAAQGSVFIGSGPRIQAGALPQPRKELTADEVTYDAITGIVQASAATDNIVTYFDPQAQVPTMARRFWWNMVTGEIRVEQPVPTTVPR